MLDKQAIAQRIPHSGIMCLLAHVQHYDNDTIHCLATNHRCQYHPLRYQNRLSIISGIEYAGQAIALHRNLLANKPTPQRAYIASLKNVKLHQQYLDDIDDDLLIHATCLIHNPTGGLYQFSIKAATVTLLTGNSLVMLEKIS
ncbi:MAG: 3-hydroxylacyl-ACP dehydratase [Gammaproteobacteria bacterium]|nr:3-hydroxylacyl-ACP dehydratase [Gammaproteobacteria bacterium]